MKHLFKAILSATFIFLNTFLFSQNVDPIDDNKLANGGYDLVSYFTSNKAVKGSKEFVHEIKGVKYQFASAENRNLFKSNPKKYLPMCDGYCSWGVAEKGIKVPVNPQTFKIIDGKLHLFFNGTLNGSPLNTLPEWNKNEAALLNQLPVNWSKLSN